MKSLLKLADESLCEKYTTNDNQNGTKICIQEIKSVLKYRFGLDFDKDIELIKKSCHNLAFDSDYFLRKLLRSMVKIVDEQIAYKNYKSKKLKLTYEMFNARPINYYDNIVYYILCNVYLILINLNNDKYHKYKKFEDYFMDFSETFKEIFEEEFLYNKLSELGRSRYKDSFMHTLLASSKVLENERKLVAKYDDEDSEEIIEEYGEKEIVEEYDEEIGEKCPVDWDKEKFLECYNNKIKEKREEENNAFKNGIKKTHEWCEANDAVCIATVFTSNYSPFSPNNCINNKAYKLTRLHKFYSHYVHTLISVIEYNHKRKDDESANLKQFYYNKRENYTDVKRCELHSSLYLTDMIYGFSMLRDVMEVINNDELLFVSKEELEDKINKILCFCSDLIIIPDVRNRNLLAKEIAKKVLENNIEGENIILYDDIKNYALYQSKIYYYIINTYALLTIDYIIKTEKSDESKDEDVTEKFLIKIINKNLVTYNKQGGLTKSLFEKIKFPINDIRAYFKKPVYKIFRKENFDKYFSTDMFGIGKDGNMFLDAYFQMFNTETKQEDLR